MWKHLESQVPKYKKGEGEIEGKIFDYKDPVDFSISKNQGLIFSYPDGSRVVFRQSGTGSSGMTIRIYFEKFEPVNILEPKEKVLAGLVAFGLELCQMEKLTGLSKPTVIT